MHQVKATKARFPLLVAQLGGAIVFSASLLLTCLVASAQEPALEPIPLPAPEAQTTEPAEPTAAVRPQGGSSAEQASFEDETGLEPIPVASEPSIILQSPVVESFPSDSYVIESEPPIILNESTVETPIESTQSAPVVESTVTESVIGPSIQPSGQSRSGSCICEQRSPSVVNPVVPVPVRSSQPAPGYTVQQRSVQPYASVPVRPRYEVPVGRVYQSPNMQYDRQGPYSVRQSTQIHPGPGRSATQVTTYEVTRYRPMTYQVTVPRGQPTMVIPAYGVRVQPVVPTGPVRSFLRRL